MKTKLTKKDLVNTKWHLKIEESKILQIRAIELGFTMMGAFIGYESQPKEDFPFDCPVLIFDNGYFYGDTSMDDYDSPKYIDYKELEFEDFLELKRKLILNKLRD